MFSGCPDMGVGMEDLKEQEQTLEVKDVFIIVIVAVDSHTSKIITLNFKYVPFIACQLNPHKTIDAPPNNKENKTVADHTFLVLTVSEMIITNIYRILTLCPAVP